MIERSACRDASWRASGGVLWQGSLGLRRDRLGVHWDLPEVEKAMKKRKIAAVAAAAVLLMSVGAGAALACKGSTVLYEDNFQTFDPTWGISSENIYVENGALIISPSADRIWSALNQTNVYTDMDFCVTYTMVQGANVNNSFGGVVFWGYDTQNYYTLDLTNDGYLQVSRKVGNRWLSPVSWRQSATIKAGLGQPNLIRVVTKGNNATIYINDQEAVSFTGQPPEGGGVIGLTGTSAADDRGVFRYQGLKITLPE
jgi:hypothetical protein